MNDFKTRLAEYKAGHKVLYLPIKQKYFDAIMAGTKVEEFREVRPATWKRYLEAVPDPDDNGRLVEKEDEDGYPVMIKYDAIHFAVGYEKVRDEALVEVEGSRVEVFVDDKDEVITYEYDGQLWVAEQCVYVLGKILDKSIVEKRKK